MSKQLAELRKIVKEPSKQEITMVYLDEESALLVAGVWKFKP